MSHCAGPGSPPGAAAAVVAQIAQELGLGDQAHSFVGNLGPVGDPQRLLSRYTAAFEIAGLLKQLGALPHLGGHRRRRRSGRAALRDHVAWAVPAQATCDSYRSLVLPVLLWWVLSPP